MTPARNCNGEPSQPIETDRHGTSACHISRLAQVEAISTAVDLRHSYCELSTLLKTRRNATFTDNGAPHGFIDQDRDAASSHRARVAVTPRLI